MISVVVSAQNPESLIPELKSSLSTQTQDSDLVFSYHPTKPDRLAGAARAQYELILFLDQDCELPRPTFLQELQNYFDLHPNIQCLAGQYQSPSHANAITRGYNQMCNFWLISGKGHGLLGGCFALRRQALEKIPTRAHQWGGEDTILAQNLRAAGVVITIGHDFSVVHHDNGSFRKFLSRAWRHGQVRNQHQLQIPRRWQKTTATKIHLTASPSEILVICLHFLVVEISGLASLLKIPQTSPKK